MRPFPNKPSYSCPTEGVVQIGTSEGMYLMEDDEEVDVFVWDEKIALPGLDDSEILSRGDIFLPELYDCFHYNIRIIKVSLQLSLRNFQARSVSISLRDTRFVSYV